MKATPTDDPLFGKGEVREDGRVIHDMHLFEVKSPDAVEGAVGLLHAQADHPGRSGVPAAGSGRLQDGDRLNPSIPIKQPGQW